MSGTRVVVTFRTTTQAMAWEKACKEAGLPGRLIPMPVQISAECGLAWLIPPLEKDILLLRAIELNLKYADVIELQ
ncbi:MAG TPA: phytoene dehydrogenase [Firmicutes bacterium]|nr:phytoene dehydrogenase [Bacillota bacterium]